MEARFARTGKIRSQLNSDLRCMTAFNSDMSDQFQYVMVLASIIIGLGITNLLLGLSAVIDRITEDSRQLRLSWAHGFWLAFVFLWLVFFWWWEFRLLEILKHWTVWNYFLIICYAVVLFFLVALLIPRDLDKVDDLNVYFLAKRRWFYAVLVLGLMIDLVDSYMKGGWTYINGTGILNWGMNVVAIPAGVIGFRSTRIRTHSAMAIVFFIWMVVIWCDVFPVLRVKA
jgi:hypothetical protein